MTYPTRWQVPSNYSATNDPDVFPALIGQEFIANKSPKFPATIIKTAASGREVRCQMASQPTWDFKVSYEFLTNNSPTVSDLQALYAFFLSRNGQAQPFFFFDPFDNAVTGQQIGVGNGVTTAFQLCRSVGAGSANAFVEAIYAVLGNPVASVGGALLYSASRTNLLLQSGNLTLSPWTGSNETVTANAGTDPLGGSTANLWTRGSASAAYLDQGIAKAATVTTYTFSCYAKASVGNFVALRLQDSGAGRADVVVNLATGAISTGAFASGGYSGVSATVTAAANGFWRITLSATDAGVNFVAAVVSFNSGGGILDATDTASNSAGFIYGPQLEADSPATSYIPTTSAAVTVAAGFTVGPYGVINFATAPTSGAVTWSGQFLFLCRFAQDNLDTEQMMLNLWAQKGLSFTSFHP